MVHALPRYELEKVTPSNGLGEGAHSGQVTGSPSFRSLSKEQVLLPLWTQPHRGPGLARRRLAVSPSCLSEHSILPGSAGWLSNGMGSPTQGLSRDFPVTFSTRALHQTQTPKRHGLPVCPVLTPQGCRACASWDTVSRAPVLDPLATWTSPPGYRGPGELHTPVSSRVLLKCCPVWGP